MPTIDINADILREYGNFGAIAIMGSICLLGIAVGIWFAIKTFNSLTQINERHNETMVIMQDKHTTSVEKMVSSFETNVDKVVASFEATAERLFQASDKTAKQCTKAVHENTNALNHVKCVKIN